MAERGSGLGVAAEPWWVPPNSASWAVDRLSSVAITWRVTGEPVPCSRLEAGDGYVAVRWGNVSVVGVYLPPSWDVARFEMALDAISSCVTRILPGPVVVAGDFNAKSALWGSPVTDHRGRILECWAAGLGLIIMNEGYVQTCVRQRGGLSLI
ncbi:uncharacterized protein [Temnothorax nylanderi]|uniref:uncharacterized protein n=1 Tax=Temnothorax nylanderi TaxID=102681 RepID=UPI003A89FE89